MRSASWLIRGTVGRVLVLSVLVAAGVGFAFCGCFGCFSGQSSALLKGLPLIGQEALAADSQAYTTDSSLPDSSNGQFDPDIEKDSIAYNQVENKFGSLLRAARKWKIGAVLKFLGNRYWQSIAEGMEARAQESGLMIDVRAGGAESDQAGQLAVMENMVTEGYDALLISPQTDSSLDPAIKKAREKGILVVNVADAVSNLAQYYVGPNHYKSGALAAQYIMEQLTVGGKLALIKGLQGVYSSRKSSSGFIETLPITLFELVAQPHCDWDLQSAFQATKTVLKECPDLKGIYCNSDIMALGAAQAVRMAGREGEVLVLGTDGIDLAYNALDGGGLAGTVDSYPYEIGRASVEIAMRILGKQRIPRVVFTPQDFIAHNSARISPAGFIFPGTTGFDMDSLVVRMPKSGLLRLLPGWMSTWRSLQGDFS